MSTTTKKTTSAAPVVYSQPADTGISKYIMGRVILAIEYLRDKDKPMTFNNILDYFSIKEMPDDEYKDFHDHLRRHRRVDYEPKGLGGKGSFRYRPEHGVRTAEGLQALLQTKREARGIPVKELRDGWPGAIEAIDKLENEHAILVTRNKKDLTPKMVWGDDPSLRNKVDPEFVELWHHVKLPTNQGELRSELVSMGLTPTSQAKAAVVKPKEKKRKAPRRGGKTTNTHMQGILKDYSHLRGSRAG